MRSFKAILAAIALVFAFSAVPAQASTVCSAQLGDGCGPYAYSSIPMSNGFDTYVVDQNVGANASSSESLTVTDPGNWSTVNNDQPYGYTGVQSFDDVQQLTNDWNGAGWGGSGSADTPLYRLTRLQVHYTESSPSGPNDIYEFAPDVWNDSYGSDVMFWADTSPVRCTDNGLGPADIIGQADLSGQAWTVYRYGGPGSEIMFILDGTGSTDPVSTGTCAQQNAGTIHILAGFEWLHRHGFMTGLGRLAQLNTGWEVTSAQNATFTMSAYSITATVR